MTSLDLLIPTTMQKQSIIRGFVNDLESFTLFDEKCNTFRPVICCVCDSIPALPNWSQLVKVKAAKRLFKESNLQSKNLRNVYPKDLLDQYSVSHERLKKFVLSPATYVNENNEVVICKQCLSDLLLDAKKKKNEYDFTA